MSKRPDPNSNPNPSKRARMPPGFRAARPPTSAPPNSAPNPSLFVTITRSDERRSTLNTQTRIISNAPEEPEHSVPSSISATEVSAFGLQREDSGDSIPLLNSPLGEVAGPPKRERHTKNSVRAFFSCLKA